MIESCLFKPGNSPKCWHYVYICLTYIYIYIYTSNKSFFGRITHTLTCLYMPMSISWLNTEETLWSVRHICMWSLHDQALVLSPPQCKMFNVHCLDPEAKKTRNSYLLMKWTLKRIKPSVVPQVRSPQYPQSAVRAAQYAAPFCGYCGWIFCGIYSFEIFH
jgi:hypothetical protein